LSMLPNNIGLTIESPTGEFFEDNHSLGLVDASANGVYTLISAEGCVNTIELIVGVEEETGPDPDPEVTCEGELIPEYRLDGVWASGNNVLSVTEGTEVLLSMLPNNIGLTIESPTGEFFDDNHSLGLVDESLNGVYTLRSTEGCVNTIELIVSPEEETGPDPEIICEGVVIPEYRLDGVWSSGNNVLSVVAGTEVLLSMLPNNIGLTIESPTGEFFDDNHSLGLVDESVNGVYTLRSAEGCVNTIEIAVVPLSLKSRINENPSISGDALFQGSELLVTPNPVESEVAVMFSANFSPKSIELYDTLGRELRAYELNLDADDKIVYLDLSAVSAGVYYIIATDSFGNRVQKKIIVKR